MELCRKCRNPFRIGDWPWCPHGKPTFRVESDIEPYVDEHISDRPTLVTSRSQKRALMNQWHGNDYVRLIERPPFDLKRRRERIMDQKYASR